MNFNVYDDYYGMSEAAADTIVTCVQQKPNALLCFATGNTPVLTYELLAQKAKSTNTDFSRCYCIGLDEWVGVPPQQHGSCHFLLHKQVFTPLSISQAHIHLFNGTNQNLENECIAMNNFIHQKGGIDCIIVGIGTNGHIGFNEPGVDVNLNAHVQVLHQSTLHAGQFYFNEPVQIKMGITLGMAQVMGAAKILLLANGTKKAAVIKKTLQGEITDAIPASCLQRCTQTVALLDRDAASELINHKT
jgi:galactosamine-6-phosphate isomerase